MWACIDDQPQNMAKKHPIVEMSKVYICHLPKHLRIEDVRVDERNFIPDDPPGK